MKTLKKVFTLLLSSLLLAGTAAAVSAFEKDVDYVVIEEVDPANYVAYPDSYPASVSQDWEWPECADGELLKGTVISSFDPEQPNNPWCWKNSPENNASRAFDGDMTTLYDPFEASQRSWAGVILDQAYQLTEVRMAVRGKYLERMNGAAIQGSNDGEMWVNVMFFGQNAIAEDYHIITSEPITEDGKYAEYAEYGCEDFSRCWISTGSYKMYRFINLNGQHGEVLELELYGNPAPATEVTWELVEENSVAIESFYNLAIDYDYFDRKNESVDGSIIGHIIGGYDPDHNIPYAANDYLKFWNDSEASYYGAAWDNNPATKYDPAGQSHNFWTGIQLDAPIALKSVKVMPRFDKFCTRLNGGRIQGSNDGVRWYTLASFEAEDVPPEGTPTWVTKDVTVDKEFIMFRYVNNGTNHGDVVDIALYADIIPGDINGDESLDIGDALLLFMHSMLPEEYTIKYPGKIDFYMDGNVDISDAIHLFMHSMLPEEYPLEYDATVESLVAPIIYINTNGQSIGKEDYVQCTVDIVSDNEEFSGTAMTGKIRGRGNSTWINFDKKPYRLKFDEKTDLFGMGKSKDWILLANALDLAMMRNFTVFRMAQQFEGCKYTTDCEFAHVYLNGQYNGLYLITEKVEEGKNRVEVGDGLDDNDMPLAPEDSGFLMEVGGDLDDGDRGFYPVKYSSINIPYTAIKSPEVDVITDEQYEYIVDYFDQVQKAIFEDDFDTLCELADIQSFVDSFICTQYILAGDMGHCFYAYKEPGGKLALGPLWDYDQAAGISTHGGANYQGYEAASPHPWYVKLIQNEQFRAMVKESWMEQYDYIHGIPDMLYELAETYRVDIDYNYRRWKVLGTPQWRSLPEVDALKTYPEHVDYFVTWLNNRVDWIERDLGIKD